MTDRRRDGGTLASLGILVLAATSLVLLTAPRFGYPRARIVREACHATMATVSSGLAMLEQDMGHEVRGSAPELLERLAQEGYLQQEPREPEGGEYRIEGPGPLRVRCDRHGPGLSVARPWSAACQGRLAAGLAPMDLPPTTRRWAQALDATAARQRSLWELENVLRVLGGVLLVGLVLALLRHQQEVDREAGPALRRRRRVLLATLGGVVGLLILGTAAGGLEALGPAAEPSGDPTSWVGATGQAGRWEALRRGELSERLEARDAEEATVVLARRIEEEISGSREEILGETSEGSAILAVLAATALALWMSQGYPGLVPSSTPEERPRRVV